MKNRNIVSKLPTQRLTQYETVNTNKTQTELHEIVKITCFANRE